MLTGQAGSPPGAGRFIDMIWPTNKRLLMSGAIGIADIFARTGPGYSGDLGGGPTGGLTGAGGYINAARWRGRDVAQFGSTVSAKGNGGNVRMSTMTGHPQIEKGHPDLNALDELACYRWMMLAAYGPPGGNPFNNTGDCGLNLIASGGGVRIADGTTTGVSFKLTAENEVSFIKSTIAGGVAAPDLLTNPATFNHQLYHMYEIRVISAGFDREAQMKILIDGILYRTLNWGAGTQLPTYSVGGIHGMSPVVNVDTGTGGFFVDHVRFTAAPTEAALQ